MYLLETAVKCRGAAAVVCQQLGENRFSAAGPVAQAGTKMIVAVSKKMFLKTSLNVAIKNFGLSVFQYSNSLFLVKHTVKE